MTVSLAYICFSCVDIQKTLHLEPSTMIKIHKTEPEELTDGVDSQDSEQKVVALLSEQLVPQQTHQPGAGNWARRASNREPQHRATHTHTHIHSVNNN